MPHDFLFLLMDYLDIHNKNQNTIIIIHAMSMCPLSELLAIIQELFGFSAATYMNLFDLLAVDVPDGIVLKLLNLIYISLMCFCSCETESVPCLSCTVDPVCSAVVITWPVWPSSEGAVCNSQLSVASGSLIPWCEQCPAWHWVATTLLWATAGILLVDTTCPWQSVGVLATITNTLVSVKLVYSI